MMGLANRDGSFTMTLYMSERRSAEHAVAFDQVLCLSSFLSAAGDMPFELTPLFRSV